MLYSPLFNKIVILLSSEFWPIVSDISYRYAIPSEVSLGVFNNSIT